MVLANPAVAPRSEEKRSGEEKWLPRGLSNRECPDSRRALPSPASIFPVHSLRDRQQVVVLRQSNLCLPLLPLLMLLVLVMVILLRLASEFEVSESWLRLVLGAPRHAFVSVAQQDSMISY